MFLDILSEFFLVRLLEFIDNIVILSVVVELLLELFNPHFKLLLGVHDLHLHLGDLSLVLLLDQPLSVLDLGLILFELLLRLLPLSDVPLLDLLDHGLDVRLLPRLLERVLLPRNDHVGLAQNSFYLALVGSRQRGLELYVFFVFRMQVEYHLS